MVSRVSHARDREKYFVAWVHIAALSKSMIFSTVFDVIRWRNVRHCTGAAVSFGGNGCVKLAQPFVNQIRVFVQPSQLDQRHEDSRSLAEVHLKPEIVEAKFIVDPNVQTNADTPPTPKDQISQRRGSEDLQKPGSCFSGLLEERSCRGIGQ